MKKSLTTILLTISLSGWTQEIPIDFFAGDNYNTIDIRFARHFKNSERFSIFSKNVIYSTWDNETSVNAIQNLNYSITHHFGLITAVQFKSSGVASRNGIRFIDHGKNQLRVGQFLYEFGPKNRLTYLIILRQLNPLTTNWQWVYQVDLLGGFDDENFKFLGTDQRVRLGFGRGSVQFGLAANFQENRLQTEQGDNTEVEWTTTSNLEGYIRYAF